MLKANTALVRPSDMCTDIFQYFVLLYFRDLLYYIPSILSTMIGGISFTRSNVKVILALCEILLARHRLQFCLITFKLHIYITNDERWIPINFGS